MTSPKPRDLSSRAELDKALEIVCRGYASKQSLKIPGVDRFGELSLFTADERDQLFAMRDLIRQYVARPNPQRPL
jgi:hypothetical protein